MLEYGAGNNQRSSSHQNRGGVTVLHPGLRSWSCALVALAALAVILSLASISLAAGGPEQRQGLNVSARDIVVSPIAASVRITITDVGFVPAAVTVFVGDQVTWYNATTQAHALQSGQIYRLYLPVMARQASVSVAPQALGGAAARGVASSPARPASFGAELPPGGTFTFTFTAPGSFPFFLSNAQQFTGLITVEPVGPTSVCGAIEQSQTWGPSGSPYTATCDIVVSSGVTLTLLPDTVMRFNPSVGMIVSGTLTAVGTSLEPITFTGPVTSASPGTWKGITFGPSSTRSQLGDAVVTFGGGDGQSGLTLNGSTLGVENTSISQNAGGGIYNAGGTLTLGNSTVSGNGAAGISGAGTFTISGTQIITNVRGLSLGLGSASVTNSTVAGNQGGGIFNSAGTVNITGSTVGGNNQSGIWSDSGNVTIQASNIAGNSGRGIYSAGTLSVSGGSISSNADGVYSQTGSATIQGARIYGNTGYGVFRAGGPSVVGATHNWWGADSGPLHSTLNPTGTGDNVSDGVTFDPWANKNSFVGSQLGIDGPVADTQAFVGGVNTASGNLYLQHVDFAYAGPGVPLEFTRSYNSLSPQAGPLGLGWTHNWNTSLVEDSTWGTVAVTLGDGHVEKWTSTGTGYQGDPGVFRTLAKNVDGSFVMSDTNRYRHRRYDSGGMYEQFFGRPFNLDDMFETEQFSYHFNPAGRLESIADTNANTTTLSYDSSGRLARVTDAVSRSLTISHTSLISPNLITQVSEPSGRILGFSYGPAGELQSSFWNVTQAIFQDSQMTYLTGGRLSTLQDAAGNRVIRATYDARGRVSFMYDAWDNGTRFDYDDVARSTTVTDPPGNRSTFQHDGSRRLESYTDPLTTTIRFTWTTSNKLAARVDGRGNETRYAYDARGNLLSVRGSVTGTFTYDSLGNLLTATDGRDNTTTFQYDGRSNVTSVVGATGYGTTLTYDSRGQLLRETDAANRRISYDRDANGQVIRYTDHFSGTTVFGYDAAGNLVSQTDALGNTTRYAYDWAGRVVSATNALSNTTVITRDAVGRVIAVADPRGGVSQVTRDFKGRPTVGVDALGNVIVVYYDTRDNVITVTDSLSQTNTYQYDALGRLITATNPMSLTTSYRYDADGNLIGILDANGRSTTGTYSQSSLPTSVTYPDGGVERFSYDANGNLISETNANGRTTTYGYDALQQLTSSTNPLGHATLWDYGPAGDLTRVTRPDGTQTTLNVDYASRTMTLNANGIAAVTSFDSVGDITRVSDTVGTTTYAYDAVGRMLEATSSPSGTVRYTYDATGNPTSITYPTGLVVSYTHDLLNRLSRLDAPSIGIDYGYRGHQLRSISSAGGTQSLFGYDGGDRPVFISHWSPVSGTVGSSHITRDNVGNILSETRPDGTTNYAYDNGNRLTSVTYPSGEQVAYTYDAVGNRTAMAGAASGVTLYSYDAGDRLLAAGVSTFGWDPNGRMITRTQGATTVVYRYDGFDRLIGIISGTRVISFTYSGDARTSKIVDGVTTSYSPERSLGGHDPLTESRDGQTTQYVYGVGLTARVPPAGTPSFYHLDADGSVAAITNGAGQRVASFDYDPFGVVISPTEGISGSFGFAGKLFDPETGLIVAGSLYYDPSLGIVNVGSGRSTSNAIQGLPPRPPIIMQPPMPAIWARNSAIQGLLPRPPIPIRPPMPAIWARKSTVQGLLPRPPIPIRPPMPAIWARNSAIQGLRPRPPILVRPPMPAIWARKSTVQGLLPRPPIIMQPPMPAIWAGNTIGQGTPAPYRYTVIPFEDQWPDPFPLDFNDAVVGYNYAYKLAQSGVLQRLNDWLGGMSEVLW
ncbi:MAG: hypothetical protein HY675_04785 [Chloroflexi bacterium]|nr:hypothetical protein [Chloroflexota bacterium]